MKFVKRQHAEKGVKAATLPRSPLENMPCNAPEKASTSMVYSSGSTRRRRKRSKAKEARAATAKKTTKRLEAAKRLEEQRERVVLETAAPITKPVDSDALHDMSSGGDRGRVAALTPFSACCRLTNLMTLRITARVGMASGEDCCSDCEEAWDGRPVNDRGERKRRQEVRSVYRMNSGLDKRPIVGMVMCPHADGGRG